MGIPDRLKELHEQDVELTKAEHADPYFWRHLYIALGDEEDTNRTAALYRAVRRLVYLEMKRRQGDD